MPALPDCAVFQTGVLPSLGPATKQEPEEIQGKAAAQGPCFQDCSDGGNLDKERTRASSAHCSNLQPMSLELQRLMGLIVTVFPCMKLRTETCIFNNERTSRGRAKEMLGREKGGS